MNCFYSERYRPQFHFTARENWLNDPNGCVFHGGEYHLFFQHNPTGREWGNMTWGHAVSRDLVHWRQLPNAIEPYAEGTIYSGSAIIDAENTSGFGKDGRIPMVAAFTHARKPFGQALAFSLDDGRSWTLYDEGRHVVPNQGLAPNERDPKVFRHAPTGRWVMVLYVRKGQARIFTSPDLKNWTAASDFVGDKFHECPDLFALPVDGNPRDERWVLLDAAFRYWVGSFDGVRFQAETGPLRGDFGANFYAGQTWSNTGGRTVQIGWMNGGVYPGMPFNQQMSFPCELSLRTTREGIRLCRAPVAEIVALRAGGDSVTGRVLSAGEKIRIGPRSDLFDVEMEIEAGLEAAFGIRLHEVEIAVGEGRLACLGKEAPMELRDGRVRMRILVDRTSLEIYGNGGESCMSHCFLPREQDTTVRCHIARGVVRMHQCAVHALRSAWRTEQGE